MALNISDYINRITEFQEAVITGSTAAPVEVYSQGDYPYWTNYLAGMVPSRTNMGSYQWRFLITIEMTLHRGLPLEGEQTQLEQTCQQDVYPVLSKFVSNPNLKTATYTSPQAGYAPHSLQIECLGIGVVDNGDVGSTYRLQFEHFTQEFETL